MVTPLARLLASLAAGYPGVQSRWLGIEAEGYEPAIRRDRVCVRPVPGMIDP
jgi:hypothetical protein